jgi:hypothetical protein
MAVSKTIGVVEFPHGAAGATHTFDPALPAGVTIRFAPAPANFALANVAGAPLDATVSTSINAKGAFPLCIKLCEPICVDSDYTLTLTLLGRSIVSVTIRGRTQFYSCSDDVL